MGKVFEGLGHADHNIPQELIDWVFNHPRLLDYKQGQLINLCLDIPEEFDPIPSSLYGPCAGDEPIKDRDTWLETRGNRKGPSRLIARPDRPVRRVAVIGVRGGYCFTMYGTQAELPSPREPWDPGLLTDELQQLSSDFWAVHALAAAPKFGRKAQ